jgi:hypothetical protein
MREPGMPVDDFLRLDTDGRESTELNSTRFRGYAG